MTVSVLVAAALAAATFLLLAACLADAHRAGLERLERAGEAVPWWLAGRRAAGRSWDRS